MWIPSKRLFTETMTRMMRMTTPHGCESFTWAHLPSPPYGAAPRSGKAYAKASSWVDEHGNYHVNVPGAPHVMWASHCDTADDHPTPVVFKTDGDFLMTDGRSILGADDKTGCTIMAMMIRAGVPGHYVFFAGEEVGCVGSTEYAKEVDAAEYDYVISFDRRGYDSIVTHQMGDRTCSTEWALELASRIKAADSSLDFKPDSGGVYTDSVQFKDIVPECTNLSVGYFHQHTPREKQDVEFAYRLCCAIIKMMRGPGLPPPVRNPFLEKDDIDKDWTYGYSSDCRLDPDCMTEAEWRQAWLDGKDI
jgi:hypothetical protein